MAVVGDPTSRTRPGFLPQLVAGSWRRASPGAAWFARTPPGYVPAVALGPLDVLTIPLRVGQQLGRMALEPIAGLAGRAIDIAEGLLGVNGDGDQYSVTPTERENGAPSVTTDPDMPAATPAAATPPADPTPVEDGTAFTSADPTDISSPPPLVADAPDVGVVEAAGAGPVPASEVDEPEHVSEEAVLVAESADVEIADGIHTDLNVAEPWKGYKKSNAQEVIESLATCNTAQLAIVRLYESTHRARKTVLEAADRELASR